ncbi:MAG: hypothetical protein HOV68_00490 [Streptomycetaceae bacterium]|nr:hypothetical protein [Streptomycetaceae bacterium]
MTSSVLRRRRWVAAVAAGLLAGGGVVFAVTHDWSSSAASGGSPSAGKSYCWGTLPGATLDRILATTPGQRHRETSGRLDYPEATDTRCAIHRSSGGGAESALPVLEFALYGAYQDLQRPEWFGAQTILSIPLGGDMYGAASDDQAWVGLPNCRAETGRFAQLIVRDQTARAGRRQLLADTLVTMTNAVRRKAGCTGPVLPAAETRPDPPPRPYRPQTLCGVTLPGPLSAEHPAWTERWTGTDQLREDCLVTDGPAPDATPVIRVEAYRGLLANLEIGERSGVENAGEPQLNSFSYGNTATYWAVCAEGPVTYLVGVKDGEGLPGAADFLTALLQGNKTRDGCEAPGTPGGLL